MTLMTVERDGNCFEEATPTQLGLFLDRVNELTPLLNQHNTETNELENPFAGLPVGDSVVGLSEEEPVDGEIPSIVGHLAVTNLGGLIKIGEGLTMPSDPTRITTDTNKGAFTVDGKIVVVEKEKVTQQNLRFAEDLTESEFTRVRVISKIDSDNFSFWLEQFYDYGSEKASFHELLYRKQKGDGSEWVMLAEPNWAHIFNGMEQSPEEKAANEDTTEENPNRFDQNRFASIMALLGEVDLSNSLDDLPTLGQSSFKVIQGGNIAQTQSETTPVQPDIPPHILEAADRAIDLSSSAYSGRMISLGKLLHRAFGDELLSEQEFMHFKRALNEHPRTQYKGYGRYSI